MDEYLEAIRNGDRETVERYVSGDPALAQATCERGVSAFLLALYHGHEELTQWLADRAGALSAAEASALGRVAELRARLDEEPESRDRRSSDGFPPLALAAYFGREDCLALLLDRGADPDLRATGSTGVLPIHSASAHRDSEVSLRMVRALVDAGADPNARQEGGWTPLHQAAAQGREEIVRLLLQRGADRDLRSADGSRPADLAEKADHRAVVDLLTG